VADSVKVDESERRLRRQRRLQGMRNKPGSETLPAEVEPRRKAKDTAARPEGGDNEMRRKAIGRIMQILTQTPADDTGMVPDTNFSKAGVAKLMGMLNSRKDKPGAKAADRVMQMLSAKGDEAQIHGASVKKLQQAGRMAAQRGGGKRKGGGF
jgi:hypothetical protein